MPVDWCEEGPTSQALALSQWPVAVGYETRGPVSGEIQFTNTTPKAANTRAGSLMLGTTATTIGRWPVEAKRELDPGRWEAGGGRWEMVVIIIMR